MFFGWSPNFCTNAVNSSLFTLQTRNHGHAHLEHWCKYPAFFSSSEFKGWLEVWSGPAAYIILRKTNISAVTCGWNYKHQYRESDTFHTSAVQVHSMWEDSSYTTVNYGVCCVQGKNEDHRIRKGVYMGVCVFQVIYAWVWPKVNLSSWLSEVELPLEGKAKAERKSNRHDYCLG